MPSGLAVDIANELANLTREADLLEGALPNLAGGDLPIHWVQIGGVAAAVEKIYSGCERVMLLIAKGVDGAPIDKADGWHRTLLDRLSNSFPNIRDAVLSAECRDGLDRFRSFRHRVRNSYGIDLDPEIVLERAAELSPVLEAFRREILAFLEGWDAASER